MNPALAARPYLAADGSGNGDRLVYRQPGGDARQMLVLAGFRGRNLPAKLTDPSVGPDGATGGWRLLCAEGSFTFQARSIDRIAEHPEFYDPLHRPFALSAIDRVALHALLWLLRLPGGARLMRAWHDRHLP